MTLTQARALPLEELELLAAAHERLRAGELLELMVIVNRATSGDKPAWHELQKRLIEKSK